MILEYGTVKCRCCLLDGRGHLLQLPVAGMEDWSWLEVVCFCAIPHIVGGEVDPPLRSSRNYRQDLGDCEKLGAELSAALLAVRTHGGEERAGGMRALLALSIPALLFGCLVLLRLAAAVCCFAYKTAALLLGGTQGVQMR